MNYNNYYDNRFDSLITVSWKDDYMVLINQTQLPNRRAYVECRNYNEVADAIKEMVVRGAPAQIHVTVLHWDSALAGLKSKLQLLIELRANLDKAFLHSYSRQGQRAINLSWALTRVIKRGNYPQERAWPKLRTSSF